MRYQRRVSLNPNPFAKWLWRILFSVPAIIAALLLVLFVSSLVSGLTEAFISPFEAFAPPFFILGATYAAVVSWLIFDLHRRALILLALSLSLQLVTALRGRFDGVDLLMMIPLSLWLLGYWYILRQIQPEARSPIQRAA